MKVQIVIQNNKQLEQNELMGIKDDDAAFSYTDFWFRMELVESFWVDEDSKEIVFSIGGADYRTKYLDRIFKRFEDEIA